MRRDVTGGKRGNGHQLQQERRRVRRPDPRRVPVGKPDPTLTSAAGLVPFGAFLRDIGVDQQLRRCFGHLKIGDGVVYPMGAQLRLLIDANLLGESRVFGLENLAADPVFEFVAGGSVPSIDTVYRDLGRFGAAEIELLEEVMAEHGLWKKELAKLELVHLDIDTTVEVLFGHQEGALPGPNPRYHGRPS
ncbi:MAG: transposase [Deltaproteobacteria bacterium]|nr:transposase [Deltaproteobacteria bacterium]